MNSENPTHSELTNEVYEQIKVCSAFILNDLVESFNGDDDHFCEKELTKAITRLNKKVHGQKIGADEYMLSILAACLRFSHYCIHPVGEMK
jgi:hypothetical protein